MPKALNYAEQYSQALANQFPYVLNFGALYATPANGRYRFVDAKTIQIPTLSTTGRVNADRDSIAQAARNYDNAWETKTLQNQRMWTTLVHPMDIDQTNQVASIANITKTYNEFQKFPEMDAYTISKLYAEWGATTDPVTNKARVADSTAITTANVLNIFDNMMLKMDNERIPVNGRILYVTNEIKYLLKEADKISRQWSNDDSINRVVNRLEEVEIIGVPAQLMKTAYDFTQGWKVADDADQVNMMLVLPEVVLTPVSYTFAKLDPPGALSQGKYVYYEESFEDVFILNQRAGGVQFNITKHAGA